MNHFFMINMMKYGIFLFIFAVISSPKPSFASSLGKDNFVCLDGENKDIKICKNLTQSFNKKSLYNEGDLITSNIKINSDIFGSHKTEILNFVKLPEDSGGLTNWLAIAAIVISIGTPLWQRFTQKSDANSQREDNINEGYWIREVIMPKINDSIFEICAEYKLICSDPATLYITNYENKILPKINELRDTFNLLTAFPRISDSITRLNAICDNLDDEIADNVTENYEKRKEGLSKFHISVTKELMLTHKSSL